MYIFTTPVPPGRLTELIPSEFVYDADISAGYVADQHTYFIVHLSTDGVDTGEKQVVDALSHVWHTLVARGVATGPMPDPIEGNPLDMIKT